MNLPILSPVKGNLFRIIPITVTYASNITLNANDGNLFHVTLTGNVTFENPTNPEDGDSITLRVQQDGTGGRTVTWGSKFQFLGLLSSIAISTTASSIDYISFRYHASIDKWRCTAFNGATDTGLDVPTVSTNLWISASQMIPRTTAGCGVNSSETTTYDQNYDTLDFDTGSDEFADFMVLLPNNWNYGSITARFYWTADSGSGTVEWCIVARAYSDDDALDQSGGTQQKTNDTLITAGDMHISGATPALTVAGTPGPNKPVQFTVFRDVSEDTLGVDARLIGVEIMYS